MSKLFKIIVPAIFAIVALLFFQGYKISSQEDKRIDDLRSVSLERAEENIKELKRQQQKQKVLEQELAEIRREREEFERMGKELGF